MQAGWQPARASSHSGPCADRSAATFSKAHIQPDTSPWSHLTSGRARGSGYMDQRSVRQSVKSRLQQPRHTPKG
jgi:hypothetical protein